MQADNHRRARLDTGGFGRLLYTGSVPLCGAVMPVSPERFLRQLVDSGLMSADEVRELRLSLPPDLFRGDDSQDMARELVACKKLTAYQAGAAYQGKANGL